jgi:rhombotail lipoprotein
MMERRVYGLTVTGFVLVLLAACYTGMKQRHTSSVVNYLYPQTKEVAIEPAVPVLTLPLNVGIVFVPEESPAYSMSVLSETQRMDLMDRIADEFRKEPFVKTIEIIPSTYLIPQGGFDNLDQIRTMYGIDVIALLSYDQVQHTDEGFATIWYWTIVGAYVVKGEMNSTNTMMDAAVYDIASRDMLFRAPGTSYVEARSTPVNLSAELREDSFRGFQEAADDMVVNLQTELGRFKERIKEAPDEVQVVKTEAYTGSGAMGWPLATLIIGLGSSAVWLGRRCRG